MEEKMAGTFSKKEALRFGWETLKANVGFFIGLLIVAGLIWIIPDMLSDRLQESVPLLAVLIALVSFVLDMVVQIGLIRISLSFCRGEKGNFSDLFSGFPVLLKFIGGSIVYGLIVLGGTLLLIVPGVIWAIKYQFYSYLIVEEGLGPVDAIKRSGVLTQGVKWNLFFFGFLLTALNLLGALCFMIGLLVTIPTSMVAFAYVYRKLSAQGESVQAAPSV